MSIITLIYGCFAIAGTEFVFLFFSKAHRLPINVTIQLNLLMFVLCFAGSLALRINLRLQEIQAKNKLAELSLLKSQINPHFLFNTLNSIYGLALTKSDNTASAIVKLAGMMRYTITESEQDFVLLDKEINFINNYVELQKIRLGNTCIIHFESRNDFPNDKIVPLLFVPFVENAFKYGIGGDGSSIIHVKLKNDQTGLVFEVFNFKHNKIRNELTNAGLGIKNTQMRLKLIYPERHSMNIDETECDFKVILKLDLR